jgi:hypothetical protein
VRLFERILHYSFEQREVVVDGIPHGFGVYAVILVPQPVTDAADISPWDTGAGRFGIFSHSDGSFADDQHFSLDSGLRFGVLSVGREIHATNKFFNKLDALEDIAEM